MDAARDDTVFPVPVPDSTTAAFPATAASLKKSTNSRCPLLN